MNNGGEIKNNAPCEMQQRPFHLFWMIGCSESMYGEKIGAINHAVRSVIPDLVDVADGNPKLQLLANVLKFSTGAKWVTRKTTSIEDFVWEDLDAAGAADLGHAYKLLGDRLAEMSKDSASYPPAVILISDSTPTDNYKFEFEKLNAMPIFQKALRIAIPIGANAPDDVLLQFAGSRKTVLENSSCICELLRSHLAKL